MTFEKALNQVGEFGRYQKLLLLLIFWTTFNCGINYYTQLFLFSLPPHECAGRGDFSVAALTQNGSPASSVASRVASAVGAASEVAASLAAANITDLDAADLQCHEYFLPSSLPESLSSSFAARDDDDDVGGEGNSISLSDILERRPCESGWEYDHSDVMVTISSEMDWVCDKDHRPATLNQAFWIGNVVGCLIWGITNDHFGRRPTLLMVHVVYFLGDVLTYLAPDYWTIMACRFLVGVSHHTMSHLPYLLVVEYVGVGSRTFPLVALMSSFCSASVVVPLVASAVHSWRALLALASIPSLVVPLFYKFLPESPSWLLCKGRTELAAKELRRVGKVNGRCDEATFEALDQALSEEMEARKKFEEMSKEEEGEKGGSIFRYRRLMRHAITAVSLCVVGFMCYYGHVENTSNLGHDLYMSFVFGALVEIPAYSVYWLVDRFGRRPVIFAAAVGSGAASVAYGFLPADMSALRLCDALAGRMFAVGLYYVALQFSLEVLPTVIRGSGAAACEIFGGLGVFLCPQIVYLGREAPWLPLLVFGALSFLGAALVLLLPETKGRAMPQTLRDGNDFGKKMMEIQETYKPQPEEIPLA